MARALALLALRSLNAAFAAQAEGQRMTDNRAGGRREMCEAGPNMEWRVTWASESLLAVQRGHWSHPPWELP